ncbi:MAG: hypothetical protein HXY47_07170 [Nitrospirae bacterium]|nr:hypothetical protein [Nitrospirota bacterium]
MMSLLLKDYSSTHLPKIILHALRKTGMRTDFRSKITGNLDEPQSRSRGISQKF